MENSNNEQYVYLLVGRTLGKDKTTLTYDVTPFNNIDAVNDAVLDRLTNAAKFNKGDVDYVSYIPHDKDESGCRLCGKINFKSGLEKKYTLLVRKIR